MTSTLARLPRRSPASASWRGAWDDSADLDLTDVENARNANLAARDPGEGFAREYDGPRPFAWQRPARLCYGSPVPRRAVGRPDGEEPAGGGYVPQGGAGCSAGAFEDSLDVGSG